MSKRPAPTDPATWAAALVATVRQDELSVAAKPAQVVRRLVAFGVETTLGAMASLGAEAPITPEARELLLVVREWAVSPRRRASLKERLSAGWSFADFRRDGGLVIRRGASRESLVSGAAAFLAAATSAGTTDDAANHVVRALERLTLAVGGELVGRVIVEGISEALTDDEPATPRGRRKP